MPKLPGRCCSLSHLGVDANGGLAEDTLVENGQDTAASALANGRADHAKVIGGSGDRGGLSAVEISSTEDVGGAALGRPVEAAAGDIDRLALVEGGGEGGGEAGEEGDGGDGELHFGC